LFVGFFFYSCTDETTASDSGKGSLSGKVINQYGQGLKNVLVTTTPASVSVSTVDSTGSYSAKDIVPGEYKLFARTLKGDTASVLIRIRDGVNTTADIIIREGIGNPIEDNNTYPEDSIYTGIDNMQLYDGKDSGKGTYVLVADSPTLRLSKGSFTIEAWVNSNQLLYGTTWGQWIISKGDDNSALDYQMGFDKTGEFLFSCSATGNVRANVFFTNQTWHHFAVVVDKGENSIVIYQNGIEVKRSYLINSPASENTSPLFIGARNYFGSGIGVETWYGQIDEVRLWNIARSPQQIRAYFNRRIKPSTFGLAAYYNFNDLKNIDIVRDITSNANNGEVLNNLGRTPSTVPFK
jgi:hypothetical protein